MESDDKTSTEEQNPFWESVPAPGLETTHQAEQLPLAPVNQPESQSFSTPQAQIVGDLGQQPTSHFSATVSNPAQSGYMGSSPSITSDYDMSEKKKGMNWGQFAIGFFAPIVIMILLSILSEFAYQVGGRGGGDIVESFFCLMPLLGIVAIVISFARGNKSLGYGLITAASIPFVLGGLFLMLLMMYGF